MSESITFRERGRAVVLRVLASVSLVLAVSMVNVASDRPSDRLTGLVLAGVCFVGGALLALVARQRVVLTQEGFELTYLLGRKSVPLSEVSAVGIRQVRNFFRERLGRPVLVLQDGSFVCLPGLQPYRVFFSVPNDFPLLEPLANRAGLRVEQGDA